MFCPKCRGEYVEWVSECVDCKIPLVESLPEETEDPKEQIELVKLLSTSDRALVAFLKSLFQAEGIPHFVVGETMMGAGAMWGGRHADVLVDSRELKRAQNKVAELDWKENS
jgi:hypothetical protein